MIRDFEYLIVFTSAPGVLPEQNDRYRIQPWKLNEIKAFKNNFLEVFFSVFQLEIHCWDVPEAKNAVQPNLDRAALVSGISDKRMRCHGKFLCIISLKFCRSFVLVLKISNSNSEFFESLILINFLDISDGQ